MAQDENKERKLTINKSQPSTIKERIACGWLHITIGCNPDGRIRFFFTPTKGGCSANLRALASCLTKFYNYKNINYSDVIQDFLDIDCPATMRWKGKLAEQGKQEELQHYGNSCPNAIARILQKLEIIEDEKEKK